MKTQDTHKKTGIYKIDTYTNKPEREGIAKLLKSKGKKTHGFERSNTKNNA